jgi:putative PEP-CTERM system TPR-repeat lipoprotein
LARIAAQSRRLDDAGTFIERALASDPRSLDGWMLKADREFALRRPDGAAEAFRKLLAVYPSNIPARLGLAAILIDQGALEAASKYVFAVGREAPHNARAAYLHALIAYRQGKLDLARSAVLAALQGAPNDPANQMLAGILLYATGAYRDATIPLLLLLEKNPAQAGPRKLYAGALMKSGQTSRALEVLLPTQAIARNDPALLGLIGGAYLRLGHLAKATEFLSKAVGDAPPAAKSAVPGPVGLALPGPDDFDRALRVARDETPPEKLLLIAHIQARQFDRALAVINSFYKEGVEDPEVLTLKGAVLIARKEFPAARAALDKALALDPMHVPAAANLAQIDLAEGDPPNARKRLQRILAKDPKNLNALAALAAMGPAFGAKDAEILEWLQQAREVSPNAMQITLMLIQHHLRTGNAPAALALSKEVEKVGGENAEVLRIVGAAQLASGDIPMATGTFSRLLALQPDSPLALRFLAQAQVANNNHAAAALLLRKALQLQPGDFDALLLLAETERRAGRLGGALALAREAQKRAPTLPTPYVLEGDVMTQQGDAAGAAKAYEEAYTRRRTGEVVIRMQLALDRIGSGTRGENALLGWLEDNPADIPVRAHFGHYLLQRERYKEAAEEYAKVLKGEPDNAIVLNNLAWILDQLRDPRALEYATRAEQLSPKDPAALDTLAGVLLRRGETERGIDLLLRAVTLAPDNAEVRLHLAQAWLKSGNKPRARRELEVLIAGFKDHPRTADARKMLVQINE